MKMKSKVLATALSLVMVFALGACKQVDVIGQVATTSFEALLKAVPDKVSADEMNGGWSLSAPDDSARFIWSKDWSKSPTHDVMLEFSAKPFVDAGLDISKLPAGIAFHDMIMVGTKLGQDELTYSGEATPLESFNQIVKLKRESIGYHEDLDHYGIDLADGNKFEWAKDMAKNDKDMVFVVDPKQFIDAGVDPAKVEGWVFGKVKVKDDKGKTVEVDKFLKPFNIQ